MAIPCPAILLTPVWTQDDLVGGMSSSQLGPKSYLCLQGNTAVMHKNGGRLLFSLGVAKLSDNSDVSIVAFISFMW